MTQTLPAPQFMTIGEVRRRLAEGGIVRSKTVLRRLEAQGVCTPIRPLGHDRRLYTVEDVAHSRLPSVDGANPRTRRST